MEKSNRIWRTGLIVSSVIIVFVAGYLFMKAFNENPVVGKWVDDDGNYTVNILNNGVLYVTDLSEGEEAKEYELAYKLDKKTKVIAILSEQESLEYIVDTADTEYMEDVVESELSDQTVTFSYSVDNNELVLTDREYGEQMILIKE